MNRLRVIDVDTGEDLSQDYTLRHRHQDHAYQRRQTGRQRDFTFSNMLNMPEVIAKIDDKHCGQLLYLQTFIHYDGILVKASREKEPMTKHDIQTVLGLRKTAFYEFFNAMLANGVIFEENGCYRINPAYHFRGSTDNTRVIKTFTAKVRSLYTPRNANKLGFIYKLLPFIHFETNTVCANPFEPNIERIEELSKTDIAELTGVSEKTVYNYLRRMKLGDEFVFAEIRRGKTRYYKLNPFIFYRKDGEPDATLREIFRLGFSGH
ncbi:helix-turn-helix domain-containing protein [Heyndrickxia coagulans]|uniref:helix-turn-helix domain-containing protein n=1 Tax=Heyndrickxia coagulans TaxID=1398 RepID=UPI00077907A0|nr:helix-turn-helix domain-containing protein [Heyndrickxia coagulans]KYC67185.1 hypothetical protein B4100_3821 [Heyndrickxia coagulans]